MNLSHTTSSDNLVKICIPLKPGGWERLETESVWAEPTDSGLYRIANTPFFAYGLSAEDVVTAQPVNGVLTLTGVSQRGGHSTYRLLLAEGSSYETPGFLDHWRSLEDVGCRYESAGKTWLAVDVPPATDIHEVYSMLENGERDGVWSFDEGHCGQSGQKTIGRDGWPDDKS